MKTGQAGTSLSRFAQYLNTFTTLEGSNPSYRAVHSSGGAAGGVVSEVCTAQKRRINSFLSRAKAMACLWEDCWSPPFRLIIPNMKKLSSTHTNFTWDGGKCACYPRTAQVARVSPTAKLGQILILVSLTGSSTIKSQVKMALDQLRMAMKVTIFPDCLRYDNFIHSAMKMPFLA